MLYNFRISNHHLVQYIHNVPKQPANVRELLSTAARRSKKKNWKAANNTGTHVPNKLTAELHAMNVTSAANYIIVCKNSHCNAQRQFMMNKFLTKK